MGQDAKGRKLRIATVQLGLIIIAVICIIYGFLVLGTNSGTGFYMVWFVIAAAFVILAVLTGFHVLENLPRTLKIVLIVIVCAAAAVFILVEIMIASSFSQKGRNGLDYIVVLGAQVRENGPSSVLKYRLDAACEYLENNPETVCIVSGGQGYNEPFAEAEGMKSYLLDRGIDAERILTEDASMNTKQNIDYSMKLFDPEEADVGIVTNNFHVFRAVAIAKKAGIRNVCGISAGSVPLFLPNNMLREFFGVAKDLLAGNI